MTKFDELMQKYVDTDRDTLVKLAQSSLVKLMPVFKQVDPKNDGAVMFIATILASVAADGTLTGKEKLFLCEVLGTTEQKVDEMVNLYNGAEGELLDIVQQTLNASGVFIIIYELKQLLEHSCCSTRCWYKLHNIQTINRLLILLDGCCHLLIVEFKHSITNRCGTHNLQKRKTLTEIFNLTLHLLNTKSVTRNLEQILLCKHIYRILVIFIALPS